jgi:molecular chaperone IbpA
MSGGIIATELKEVVAMLFDFTPLYRSSVGFDRIAKMLDEVSNFEAPTYPPYNIEQTGENAYRITMAVAGFSADDLKIEVKEGVLTISGKRQEKEGKSEHVYLYQGIAGRNFERRFRLAEYVTVRGAKMENGLLHVDLERELPEAMKPRTIPVTQASDKKVIEGRKEAA